MSSQLARIDLSNNSRSTLVALIKLLAPHIPYSLHILGSVLNAGSRCSTLQHVDPSKVVLWSTTPLDFDVNSTIDSPELFSVVTFSHQDHHFRFFCSGESGTSDLPTEAEAAHVKLVFESLLRIAGKAHPTYNSSITVPDIGFPRHRIDGDPPLIAMWCVHTKWVHVLAPMSTYQHPGMRYTFPRGALTHGDPSLAAGSWMALQGANHGGGDLGAGVEVTEIQATDLPFVHGASAVPRSEAYILSRAPYSVCLRVRSRGGAGTDNIDEGQPAACALVHSDGSIGALRVDPKYQRLGLGRLVVRALAEKLDFVKDRQGDLELISNEDQDLGGGALGWNWAESEIHNEAGNGFFRSLLGDKGNRWVSHWVCMVVDPNK